MSAGGVAVGHRRVVVDARHLRRLRQHVLQIAAPPCRVRPVRPVATRYRIEGITIARDFPEEVHGNAVLRLAPALRRSHAMSSADDGDSGLRWSSSKARPLAVGEVRAVGAVPVFEDGLGGNPETH